MKILLTGGAGFIGSHVLDALLTRGDEITVVDDFNDYYDPSIKRRNIEGKKIHVAEADLRDSARMKPLFEAKPDILVHLAARAGVRPSVEDPALYSDVNIGGTVGLYQLCREYGVERVVFASSSSVYGNAPVPFSETNENLHPISPYGATKLAAEYYSRVYSQSFGLKITCLRFFTVYGPRQRPDMAIHKFTKWIDEGNEIPMFGDGTTRRDYTFVDDIVEGVVKAIDQPEPFAIYNLGESRTVALRELIAILESVLGKKAKIKKSPEQAGDVRETFADITRARKCLGYDPKVPIENGIQRFVQWYRAQGTS